MTGRNFKLRELRAEKRWTLRNAAQLMGVSMTVLFNAEQGVMPRVDHAVQIARAYETPVEELWSHPLSACPSKSSRHQSRGLPPDSPSL